MPDFRIEDRDVLEYCAYPMTVPVVALPQHVPAGYRELDRYLGERGIEERGPSVLRYRRGSETGTTDIEVGWIMPNPVAVAPPFVSDTMPAGRYVVGWHNGPYADLGEAARGVIVWAKERGVELAVAHDQRGDRWTCWYELYLSDPSFGPRGPSGTVEMCLLTRG